MLGLFALIASSSGAQSVAPITADDLAKYDTNKNGRLDPAELAAKQEAESTRRSGETITLSPFEVVAEATGYFQSNTMSGTRLNSKIEDLGQSITVMTKEQMVDFAMLDINDMFEHMAGTEGTNSYSDFVVDRTGAVTDNVSLDPNNANRVRGIGNANIAFNNIATTGRVPVDPLWMDSLELSRGPNANIFGLGNAAGTVNQVPATANLTRNFSRVDTRADSYGGWRAALDVNRTLLGNRFAFRGSLAHQHTGFIREPAGEEARRLSFQVKARPFDRTTLAVSWYRYSNVGTRPNYTTPRDNITAWIAAGRPAWDPITRLITLNGVTYGQGTGNTLVAGGTTAITNLPTYFNNSPSDGRSFIRIGTGSEAPYLTLPTVTNATTPAAGGVSNNIRFVSTSAVNSYGAAQPLFATYAALADKSIYDWESVNLQASNKQWDDVNTYLAQLDQMFVQTRQHTLAGQVTYMKEDAKQIQDLPLGPASVNGVIGEIYADPNTRNFDGSPNPYFGRPYLRSKEPYLRERPMLWETTRAQLAYRLDFSQDGGWSKWLGAHQVLGYYEYKDQQSRLYAWRNTAKDGNHQWLRDQFNAGIPLANRVAAGAYPGSHNHMRIYEFYYVGSTPGAGIEYAPSRFPQGSTIPLVWGNTGNFRRDPVTLGYTPSIEGSGNTASKQTIVKTKGGVLQSSLLQDRLVATFGLREDRISDRNAVFTTLTPDLLSIDYGASDRWQDGSTWRLAEGKTKSASFVARPFRDLGFLRNEGARGSGIRRLLAEAVSGLSLTYNKSDNFIPQGPAVDLFLRPLPNQTGHAEEYGLWLNLFRGKLSLRYNRHESSQINKRDGDINTIAQRVLRADGILNSSNADAWNLQDRARDWVTTLNPTWNATQVRTEVARIMGLDYAFMDAMEAAGDAGRIAATQDVSAKGDELEIYYNPTRAWTISASVTKTETVNKNAGSTIEDWIASRMPIWERVEDPRFTATDAPNIRTGATGHLLWRYIAGTQFTAFGYNNTNSAATNYTTFVEGPLAVYRQLEGRPRPQMSKYVSKFSTRYRLSDITENAILKNMTVGGSMRWTDKKAIGFLGVQSLPATITALDANKPVYTPAETYLDLFVAYRTRLFRDRVRANFQINARNVGEKGGGLLPTQVFPDGTPLAYRIIDPRQFIISASFEL